MHFTAIPENSRETLLLSRVRHLRPAISEESHNYVNNGSLRLRLRKWILVVKLINFSRKKMVLFVRSIPIIWISVVHQFFILLYDDPCVGRNITNTLKAWLGDWVSVCPSFPWIAVQGFKQWKPIAVEQNFQRQSPLRFQFLKKFTVQAHCVSSQNVPNPIPTQTIVRPADPIYACRPQDGTGPSTVRYLQYPQYLQYQRNKCSIWKMCICLKWMQQQDTQCVHYDPSWQVSSLRGRRSLTGSSRRLL